MKTWQQTLEDIEFEIQQKGKSFSNRAEIDRYLLDKGYYASDIDEVWRKLQKIESSRPWLLYTGRGILVQWVVIGLIAGIVLAGWRFFESPTFTAIASPTANNLTDVAFSPNGRYLSALDNVGQLLIWEMPERRLFKNYNSSIGGKVSAGRIFWSADSRVVLGVSGQSVRAFRLEDNQTIFSIESTGKPPSAALSPDSKYIAVSYYPDYVALYDLATNQPLKVKQQFLVLGDMLQGLKFSPDSKFVAAHITDTLWFWNIETEADEIIKPTILKQVSELSSSVFIKGFDFSPIGPELAVTVSNDEGGTNHETQLWDWRNGILRVATDKTPGAVLNAPVYRPDGERLALLSKASGKKEGAKAELQLLPPALIKKIGSVQPFNLAEDVQRINFSPDSQQVVLIAGNKLLLANVDKLRS